MPPSDSILREIWKTISEESYLLLATGTRFVDNGKSNNSDQPGCQSSLCDSTHSHSVFQETLRLSKQRFHQPPSGCKQQRTQFRLQQANPALRAKVHLCIPNQIPHKRLSEDPQRENHGFYIESCTENFILTKAKVGTQGKHRSSRRKCFLGRQCRQSRCTCLLSPSHLLLFPVPRHEATHA